MPDSDSELGDLRTDGSSARALTTVMGAGGGFIPLHKEPPRYIRVRPHNKKTRNFNRLFLAQELQGGRAASDDGATPGRTPAVAVGTKLLKGDGAAIWAAEFSLDGKYLAVAGKDQVIRIFAVISTPEERQTQEEDEILAGSAGLKLSAPVFLSKPAREFRGHTGDVLSLSWSKNNFLLSSSMDKTVRLWHMSRDECLCTFAHDDLVTSIAFHPTDDRYFLAGSLDAQLRLWSIPEKKVAFAAPTNEFITAVAFSPDGSVAICGLLTGVCKFFETQDLKQKFQIHVRSTRGKNAKGSKITGIRTFSKPRSPERGADAVAEDDDVRVLITSNDSRVRIYNLKDRLQEVKLKGLENQSSQIHARFSDDAKFIISGSEDRRAYIWSLDDTDVELKDKQPYECFDAHPEVVTTALLAPIKTKQLLSDSGDPIYDLCNPPPVQLVGLDELTSAEGGSGTSEGGRTAATPTTVTRKPEEKSPAYIERSKHSHGNIIITTDRTGTIKVFRQDCAYTKRQQNLWETGSKFSGKIAGLNRSGSIMTRTSGGGSRIHSRRGSLNLGQPAPPAQQASDRIMSWRQDVEGGGGGSSINRASVSGAAARSDRSPSPMKANRTPVGSAAMALASEARRQPYAGSPNLRGSSKPTSPTSSLRAPRIVTSNSSSSIAKVDKERDRAESEGPTLPPTPSFSLISASDSDSREEKSDGFWGLTLPRWKGLPGLRYSGSINNDGGVLPIGDATLRASGGGPAGSRRSFAAGEVRKLKFEESESTRRRSMIAPSVKISTPVPVLEEAGREKKLVGRAKSGRSALEEEEGKRRTDSGVGELSEGDG